MHSHCFFTFPQVFICFFIDSYGLITKFDVIIYTQSVYWKGYLIVIMTFTPVMLLKCFINTQPFVHNKSRSTTPFIKEKPRDLQKLIRYISEIVTSMFKDGTGGWAG